MGFGKDGKGVIVYDQAEENIGAVPVGDLVTLTNRAQGVMVEDYRMLKCDYWINIRPAAAIVIFEGPVMIGMAHGDLTAAEIEAALESVVLGAVDLVANEEAGRPVWPLELILLPDADQGNAVDLSRKGSFTPRWTFPNPAGWQWWVWNLNAVTAVTTGSFISIVAKTFGVWVT